MSNTMKFVAVVDKKTGITFYVLMTPEKEAELNQTLVPTPIPGPYQSTNDIPQTY